MSDVPKKPTAQDIRKDCTAPRNHDWEDYESERNPKLGGWYLTMRCTKCGAIFRQVIHTDGSIWSNRRYKYPKGYRDPLKWNRAQWRLNYLLQNIKREAPLPPEA